METLANYPNSPGYAIKKEVPFALTYYQHSSELACHILTQSANHGLAIGAFKIRSAFPVSWVFCSEKGAIHVTEKNNRGKDLAKAVVGLVGRISEKIISLGLIPYVPLNAVLRFHTKLFHFNVVIFSIPICMF